MLLGENHNYFQLKEAETGAGLQYAKPSEAHRQLAGVESDKHFWTSICLEVSAPAPSTSFFCISKGRRRQSLLHRHPFPLARSVAKCKASFPRNPSAYSKYSLSDSGGLFVESPEEFFFFIFLLII